MSTATIAAGTAVLAANFTDAAVMECEDANGDTKKVTPAQMRVQVNTNGQAFAMGTVGGAGELNRITKKVTGIADNTATSVLTITVPNAAHSARVTVWLTGSLGAGGAIGANEASESIAYNIGIARTAGVNAVAAISAAFGESTSVAVAGAATCAVSAVMSAVSGAVDATNTFTVNVTIARGSGSSDNHTCTVLAEVQNGNATGVTLS